MRTSLYVLTLLSALTTGCPPNVDPPACIPPDPGVPDPALPGPITLVLPSSSCTFVQVSVGMQPTLSLNDSFPVKLTANPATCASSSTGSNSVKLECVLLKDQFAAYKDYLGPYRIDISHKYWLPLFPVSDQSISAAASVLLKQSKGTIDASQITYSVPVKPYRSAPTSSEPTVAATERLLWKPPVALASDDLTLTFEASFVCSAAGTVLRREIEWEVTRITLTPVPSGALP